MRRVVLISGRLCTGKSGLANSLKNEFGYEVLSFGDDVSLNQNVYASTLNRLKSLPVDVPIVVDSIQSKGQLAPFRAARDMEVIHVHLYAPFEVLKQRFAKGGGHEASYMVRDSLRSDEDVDYFKKDADVRINTDRTDNEDTFVRVAARLGLYSPPDVKCVDVVVGGQYGSEGKGHIAAYLARDYEVLVRVGGPNAGHTVASHSGVYTYHQLPSGCRDTNARVLLGPGMTIDVEGLLGEISECRLGPDRLFIDPQAMIIEAEDRLAEKEIVTKIASTGRGGGAAAARRIRGRQPGIVRLARDIPQLRDYVGTGPNFRGSTRKQLEIAYRQNLSILLEGTQGSGLSLYHGTYPFVTSRETNVAGCLAEAGISPSRVRRIIMVVRPTPIRVGNPDGGTESSGPLKHEVTFEAVAKSANLDASEVLGAEITSTTRRPRRVGWFEWEQFRDACALNAPTDIVLTFADYIQKSNREARRFEQLSEDTIKFIEELERVAHAPVSLINTRFPRDPSERIDLRTVIDRRNWTTRSVLDRGRR